MSALATGWPRLGATPLVDGAVEIRVWAPARSSLAVRIGHRDHELAPIGDGVFAATVGARVGDDYMIVGDDGRPRPDPCSRYQPRGIHGPSRVVDPGGYPWSDLEWPGVRLDELSIYELHVGAFSPEGTFDAVVPRLPELADLGVTAVELMPIATFPGNRNWGYDGVYTFAPHPAYGGPEGLCRLVDEAHRHGLAVILDVVYNHIGPGSEAMTGLGPYVGASTESAWGDGLDYGRAGVREWAIQNAEMWIRDYHIDGLRLDATHAVIDDSETHVLAELAQRVRDLDARTLVISEMEVGDLRPIEDWGHDAQWSDEFHHVLHVLLTGENDGYYGDYRPSVADLADELTRRPPERLVYCSQNHDQVGNRARGDRPRPEELRIRAAALLFAPQTPLLFMGEEYGEQRPFQYFTDHDDPAIAEATRRGRRAEFEKFAAFSEDGVPDPNDASTMERSRLDPTAGDCELRAFYRRLLATRRRLPRELQAAVDEQGRMLRLRRGGTELVLNFSRQAQDGVAPLGAELRT